MLVLSRNEQQSIRIGNDIVLTVLEIINDKVRLGVQAPPHIHVHRAEVYERILISEPDTLKQPRLS